jgi:O-antigen ligase/tetratricopeptide (TPR) repeat protein
VALEAGSWFDRAIVAGVVALVVLPPLLIGAVHPWAFISAELAVFVLTVVWAAKLALRAPIAHQPALTQLRGLVVPLGLFIVFIAFQLVPLPPTLLRVLSPSTYQLYSVSLSGWPETAPYQKLFQNAAPPPPAASLPSVEAREAASAAHLAAAAPKAPRWRPLSIAQPLTLELLLKVTAYAVLLFVVMLYPFGPSTRGVAEKRFYRSALITILVSGLVVACAGVLERVFWNGKIMWVFVPYDWGRAQPGLFGRASGPFVNPDHFASYLNLVLPIAVTGVLFPTFLTRRNSAPFRVFCAVVALIISIALLLSLSRAGWLGAVVSVSTLVFMSSFMPHEKRPRLLRLPLHITLPLCAAVVVVILASTSLFVGDQGRYEADMRLKNTIVQGQSVSFRAHVWRDTLPMLRDFPLFGVGLGAFQDSFPRYQSPPWNPSEVRETHNDYLELLVSAGAIGFGTLAWFFATVARRLYLGLRELPPEVLPVAAALAAAMSAMAFQEFFDFNLQIPANAILFTILLGLAMRLIATRLEDAAVAPDRSYLRARAGAVTVVAVVLSALAVGENKVPYPYSLKVPLTPEAARTEILSHPASSRGHLWMVGVLGSRIPADARANELARAVWLNPTDPEIRDFYARSLLFAGDSVGALKQVTISAYNSPWLDNHFYLTTRNRNRLLPAEREAVEKGLKMAVAHHFENAVWVLGGLYAARHRFAEQARLFEGTAASETDPKLRENLLIEAGRAYANAGDLVWAEKELRIAAKLDSTDYRPYSILATMVYAPHKDLAAAKAVVNEGIADGGDPFELYLALADATKTIGNLDAEEAALSEAVSVRPSNFAAVARLASVYMKEKRFDQAVLWGRRATEIRPDSAEAFYQLGLAEQATYQYFAAIKDFGHAVELAPGDAQIKAHYIEFQRQGAARELHQSDASAP